jgi:hypothetical protein
MRENCIFCDDEDEIFLLEDEYRGADNLNPSRSGVA